MTQQDKDRAAFEAQIELPPVPSAYDEHDGYIGYSKCDLMAYARKAIAHDRQQHQPEVTDDMRMAVRFAPSSAHWSKVLTGIFGPDAREGIASLEKQLRDERQQRGEPVAWPTASDEDVKKGWFIDYRFLEKVERLAGSRTDYTTSMEATEQVLLAAVEVLRENSQPAEPNEWKDAVDHELTNIHSTADSFPNAKEAVKALVDWHVSVSTDPVFQQPAEPVNGEELLAARDALVDMGYLWDGDQWVEVDPPSKTADQAPEWPDFARMEAGLQRLKERLVFENSRRNDLEQKLREKRNGG